MPDNDQEAQKALELETHKARLQANVQQQRVGAEFAMLAIRTLIAVSGGALLAILTFIGNLWTKDEAIARSIANSMVSASCWFMGALFLGLVTAFLGLVTAMLGYLSAFSHTRGSGTFLANHASAVRLIAFGTGVLSLVVIGVAFFEAGRGLRPP